MFKVITEMVPAPIYLMICDHPHCMEARQEAADLSSRDGRRLSQKQFLEHAEKEGWSVGMDRQMCVPHTQAMLAMIEERKRQTVESNGKISVMKPLEVVPATDREVVAFGKGPREEKKEVTH